MQEASTANELLSSLVSMSCQASGVPEKVTDRDVLLDVMLWLRQVHDD